MLATCPLLDFVNEQLKNHSIEHTERTKEKHWKYLDSDESTNRPFRIQLNNFDAFSNDIFDHESFVVLDEGYRCVEHRLHVEYGSMCSKPSKEFDIFHSLKMDPTGTMGNAGFRPGGNDDEEEENKLNSGFSKSHTHTHVFNVRAIDYGLF